MYNLYNKKIEEKDKEDLRAACNALRVENEKLKEKHRVLKDEINAQLEREYRRGYCAAMDDWVV